MAHTPNRHCLLDGSFQILEKNPVHLSSPPLSSVEFFELLEKKKKYTHTYFFIRVINVIYDINELVSIENEHVWI